MKLNLNQEIIYENGFELVFMKDVVASLQIKIKKNFYYF